MGSFFMRERTVANDGLVGQVCRRGLVQVERCSHMPADRDALAALKTNEAAAAIAQLASRVLLAAAEARSWTSGRARAGTAAADAGVQGDKVETPFGDALAVLDRGPEDGAERALARALAAVGMREAASDARPVDQLAGDVLWLAVHTPFDATELLDAALPEDAAAGIWTELGEIIRKVEGGTTATLGRAEALVAAAALAGSASASARRVRTRLGDAGGATGDAVLSRLLLPPPGSDASGGAERFSGEVVAAPRSAMVTVLLAFTGILFLGWVLRLVGRLALAYRRPAEVTVEDASIRIRARTLMLGRVLGEREIVIARGGLVRATREVRYPRLAFYAGLLALAVGSYVGVAALVDGTRAASPSLLLAGLVIVAVGIALDVLFSSIGPGVTRTCRVAFVPRSGAPVCVGGVAFDRADAALAHLAAR
jgi:hypothetical protein